MSVNANLRSVSAPELTVLRPMHTAILTACRSRRPQYECTTPDCFAKGFHSFRSQNKKHISGRRCMVLTFKLLLARGI